MRRTATLSLLAGLVLAGCGQDPAGSPLPPPSPTATAGPTPLAGASCDDRSVRGSRNVPDFVEVDVGTGQGVDRVTFRFRPRGGATGPPSYDIRFTDELVTDGEGRPVEVEGSAFVAVSFTAVGYDLDRGEAVYTGPTSFRPGAPAVRQVEQTGDFEGIVSWGIGLAERTCFVVEDDPDRLTLLFPHP
ncbi:MAG: hypothetical protein M3245_04320 [Actinomycetota bacterium]|nr:hypothetical protein [Actinomycetota bacterium]